MVPPTFSASPIAWLQAAVCPEALPSAPASVVESFRADAIDDGELWKKWNKDVTPEARVDWQLLSSITSPSSP